MFDDSAILIKVLLNVGLFYDLNDIIIMLNYFQQESIVHLFLQALLIIIKLIYNYKKKLNVCILNTVGAVCIIKYMSL